MLRSFQIALGFLTVLRVDVRPMPELDEVGKSAWAFPVVGALIGIALAVTHVVLTGLFPVAVSSILVVIVWVVLTGGLHLDGWTDCWDSIAASVSRERRREILKDSRLGTFGALGLLLLLALKIAAISGTDFRAAILFVAPVIGRTMMVTASYGSRCANEGMAGIFLSGLDKQSVRWAWGLGIILALASGLTGLLAVGCAYLGALGFRSLAESRLGIVNGDVIGAMCELSETLVLLIFCVDW
jgi:adenosylcobinamide-GDP ribazoletransferase